MVNEKIKDCAKSMRLAAAKAGKEHVKHFNMLFKELSKNKVFLNYKEELKQKYILASKARTSLKIGIGRDSKKSKGGKKKPTITAAPALELLLGGDDKKRGKSKKGKVFEKMKSKFDKELDGEPEEEDDKDMYTKVPPNLKEGDDPYFEIFHIMKYAQQQKTQ